MRSASARCLRAAAALGAQRAGARTDTGTAGACSQARQARICNTAASLCQAKTGRWAQGMQCSNDHRQRGGGRARAMRTIDDDVVVPCAPQGGAVSAETSPCSRGRASSCILQCMAFIDMSVAHVIPNTPTTPRWQGVRTKDAEPGQGRDCGRVRRLVDLGPVAGEARVVTGVDAALVAAPACTRVRVGDAAVRRHAPVRRAASARSRRTRAGEPGRVS